MRYPAIENKTKSRDEKYFAFKHALRLYNEAESWEEFAAERTVHGYNNVNRMLGIDTFRFYYFMISYGKRVKKAVFWTPFSAWMLYVLTLLVFGHNDNAVFSVWDKLGAFLLCAALGALCSFVLLWIFNGIVYLLCSKIDTCLHNGRYKL